MKKLRLIVTEQCAKNCEGCCNKQLDMSTIPVETYFKNYDEFILTGGEPLLDMPLLFGAIAKIINKKMDARILVYTAKTDDIFDFGCVLTVVDGMTVTLHEQDDVEPLRQLLMNISSDAFLQKSMRLNIFSGIVLDMGTQQLIKEGGWVVKDNMEWIENCPLPEGEILRRYEG